jgi:hypothetical protein
MKTLKYFGWTPGLVLIVLMVVAGWISEAKAYESITSRENNVSVDVIPVQLVSGKPAKFEVRMNTHSVPLEQDLVAVSTLKDDQDGNYQPTKWQGSPPGGHHRRGVLEFPVLKGQPKSVKLVIREVAGVPQRIFGWKIEK